jgi:hypothetical protein
MKLSRLLISNTSMKLLTTIAAVLISISAFSQDLIEYKNGTFTQNGEELSMEQIDDLTLLHKAGRGNVRRANRFVSFHKNQNYRIANNIGSLSVGSAAGFFGGIGVLLSPYLISTTGRFGDNSFGHTSIVMAVTTGLCAVSYKAFSRVALSPAGCLRKRDREFYKVADKINQAIAAANQ